MPGKHGMKADARPLHLYRNFRAWLALLLALMLLAFFLINHALKPRQVSRLLLDRTGKALGLEITATGPAGYRLLGTPALVLRDVVAREPGAKKAVLQAKRLYISLPWSTIRARGAALVATRIELDSPVLDLPAMQHWLATRPPSEKRLPTLGRGLRVRDGSLVNNDASRNWRADGIDVDFARLVPGQPLHAQVRGRYLDAPLSIPVDLAITVMHPGALIDRTPTGFAAYGEITIERGEDWQLPATVILSGPLLVGADDLRITPVRLGMVARYVSGDTRLPFSLGLYGPLRFDEAVWTLSPASVALQGRGDDPATDPLPSLTARGALGLGHTLALQLEGILPEWPAAWPALPPPIGQSDSPLPFVLRYSGSPDLSDLARLRLRRDATRFDGTFRLHDISRWITEEDPRPPLPPLDGSVVSPRLEIAGAQLEGVRITIGDPDIAPASDPDASNEQP